MAKGGFFAFIEKRGRWAGGRDGWFAFLHSCNYKLAVGNIKWWSNGRVLWNDGLYLSQSEAIEDEDFFQRHHNYERREKLHWSCWDQDRRHRIRSVCILVYCKAILLHVYSSVHIFRFFFPTGHPGKAALLYLWETILLTVTHLYILLFPSPGPSVLLKIHQKPVWMKKRSNLLSSEKFNKLNQIFLSSLYSFVSLLCSQCNHGGDVRSPWLMKMRKLWGVFFNYTSLFPFLVSYILPFMRKGCEIERWERLKVRCLFAS